MMRTSKWAVIITANALVAPLVLLLALAGLATACVRFALDRRTASRERDGIDPGGLATGLLAAAVEQITPRP